MEKKKRKKVDKRDGWGKTKKTKNIKTEVKVRNEKKRKTGQTTQKQYNSLAVSPKEINAEAMFRYGSLAIKKRGFLKLPSLMSYFHL